MGKPYETWHVVVIVAVGVGLLLLLFLWACIELNPKEEDEEKEETDNARQVQNVSLDPGQMVQLMRNEQPLSESLPLMLNSISNQEESQTGPGSNPIVRLDSQQLELLMMHQKEMNQESSQCARKAE